MSSAGGGSFQAWFDQLAVVGRLPSPGGWRRFAWTPEDAAAREWFRGVAGALALDVESDRNGNLWAWWGVPEVGAVATGSHLDTVADGGAYDGALGVVGGFAAVEALRRRHGEGPPPRPLAVVAFADEEGGRFNLPCFGSRLLTGALGPAEVLDRSDADGVPLREALAAAGVDPGGLNADPDHLALLAGFVELHVEQGRALQDLGVALAVATAMWPHGRWRLTLSGEANHAGTTRLRDRHDPTLVAGHAVESARRLAVELEVVATVGRLVVEPNSPNTIPSGVTAWLDVRAPDDAGIDGFVARWDAAVRRLALDHAVAVDVVCDARTEGVAFDPALRERITARLDAAGVPSVPLDTAAGHDAGVLARHVPAAMLFVRNPTGASHTPREHASVEDCLAGVEALVEVLEDLVWG